MGKNLFFRIILFISISFFEVVFSQLVDSKMQIWEKSTAEFVRDSAKCLEDNLLNFNCNVKGKLKVSSFKYQKDKPHTLILVHSTKSEKENIWQNEQNQTCLTNTNFDKHKSGTTVNLKKVPSIFSYSSSSLRSKLKEDSINIKLNDINIYELVFNPKKISVSDLKKIHTYLALKYGISLEKEKYISSDDKTIWDPEKHKDFKHRPTGIGRDDKNELYQKQSSNQEDRFLTVSKGPIKRINFDNPSSFKDMQFVIWSDDNKEISLKKENQLEVLKRTWEVNFLGDVSKEGYHVRIKKSVINPKSLDKDYWLLIYNSEGKYRKIRGEENRNFVDFPKVKFDEDNSNSDFFTFAMSPSDGGNIAKINTKTSEVATPLNSVDLDKIELYPNPVKMTDSFTILFPSIQGLEITIFDGAGRLLERALIDSKTTKYQNQIRVQGVYLIVLMQYQKPLKTFKLIVK